MVEPEIHPFPEQDDDNEVENIRETAAVVNANRTSNSHIGAEMSSRALQQPTTAVPLPTGDPSSPLRIILCIHVLPVKLKFDESSSTWSAAMDEALMFEEGYMYIEIAQQMRDQGYEVCYIGATPNYVPTSQRFIVEEVLKEIDCYPVWIDRRVANRFYQGYCRTILWPVFHNVIDAYSKTVPLSELNDMNNTLYPGRNNNSDNNVSRADEDDFAPNSNSHPNAPSSSMGMNRPIFSVPIDEDTEQEGMATKWMPQKDFSITAAMPCWPDYCEVNKLFAQKVVEVAHKKDIVWVHDYHLLVLPSFLLRKIPEISIGFFLHIPFPSSECFRVLAHREDILKSMLCADQIGFHLYEYARHFLTCCKRMLGLKCEPQKGAVVEVTYHHRTVRVTSSHIGINPNIVNEMTDVMSRGHADFRSYCKKMFGLEGKFVFLALGELEQLTGVLARLIAFEYFLEVHQHLKPQNKVVLFEIGIRPDARPEKYQQTRQEALTLINRINQKYKKQIIRFEEKERLDMHERIALYNAADCLLVTPIRGRLDVGPFEYQVATKKNPGCVITSEFSTSFRMMAGVFKINPYNIEDFSEAMASALKMSPYEKQARNARDISTIEQKTIREWCSRFLYDIREAAKNNSSQKSNVLFGFGFGLGLNVGSETTQERLKKKNLRLLDTAKLSEAYLGSKARLFLFDYSGTLVETSRVDAYVKSAGEARTWHYEKQGGGHKRPAGCLETRDSMRSDVKEYLVKLAADPNNTVVVISADLRDEVAHALEGMNRIVMVAENGYVFKMSGSNDWEAVIDEAGSGVWYTHSAGSTKSLGTDDDLGDVSSAGERSIAHVTPLNHPFLENKWQDEIMALMQHYTMTTNGTFCWQSPSAVSFNFVLADPEWGFISAESLFLELESNLAGLPLSVEKGKGYVTVRLAGVNRGAATAAILAKLNRKLNIEHIAGDGNTSDKVDFIWCVGDDIEDEANFVTVQKYKHYTAPSTRIFNTKVGWTSKSTRARYFVDEPIDFWTAIHALLDVKSGDGKFRGFDPSESMRLAASNFITKESMVNLALRNENPSLSSLKTNDSFIEDSMMPRPKDDFDSEDGQTKLYNQGESDSESPENLTTETGWGKMNKITESWTVYSENETKKASGLKYASDGRNLALGQKMKKNVSFKDLPKYTTGTGEINGAQRSSLSKPARMAGSTAHLTKTDNSRRESIGLGDDSEVARTSTRIIPHSPSYIATPEELAELFPSEDTPPAGSASVALGLGPALLPTAGNSSELPVSTTLLAATRLNDNEYDLGVRDIRRIPPTRSFVDVNMSHSLAANTNTNESESAGTLPSPPRMPTWTSTANKRDDSLFADASSTMKVILFGSAMFLFGSLSGIVLSKRFKRSS